MSCDIPEKRIIHDPFSYGTHGVHSYFVKYDPPNLPPDYKAVILTAIGGATNPAPGIHIVKKGRKFKIEAIPDDNWRFIGFRGDYENNGYPVFNEKINETINIIAYFERIRGTNFLETEDFNTIDKYAVIYVSSTGGPVDKIGKNILLKNENITIKAYDNDDYKFIQWSNGETTPEITLLITSGTNYITAIFDAIIKPSKYLKIKKHF